MTTIQPAGWDSCPTNIVPFESPMFSVIRKDNGIWPTVTGILFDDVNFDYSVTYELQIGDNGTWRTDTTFIATNEADLILKIRANLQSYIPYQWLTAFISIFLGNKYIVFQDNNGYIDYISILLSVKWTNPIDYIYWPTNWYFWTAPQQQLDPSWDRLWDCELTKLPEVQQQLPAPIWESLSWQNLPINLSDGNIVLGSNRWVRVPLINKDAITRGDIYIEFGRLKKQYYKTNPLFWVVKTIGSRINWYSRWDNDTSPYWKWYSSGSHTNQSWLMPTNRPNMFQVTHQWYLTPPLPRWSFYRLYNAKYYNGDFSNWINSIPYFNFFTPHMTGGKIHQLAGNVLQPITNIWRRVLAWQLKDKTHLWSEWYARLVVIKEGRVVQQWPHSEPLFIERQWLPYWDENKRQYSVDNLAAAIKANITIGHKYKK